MQTLDELIAELQKVRKQHGGQMRVKVLDLDAGAHDVDFIDVGPLRHPDGSLTEDMATIVPVIKL